MSWIGKYLIKTDALKERVIVGLQGLVAECVLVGGYLMTAAFGQAQLMANKQAAKKFFREGQMYRVKPNPIWIDVWKSSSYYPRRAAYTTAKSGTDLLERIPPGTIFMVLGYQTMLEKNEIKILLGERVGWIDTWPPESLAPWDRFELCDAATLMGSDEECEDE